MSAAIGAGVFIGICAAIFALTAVLAVIERKRQ